MSEPHPTQAPRYLRMAELCHASGLSKPTIANYLKLNLLPPPLKVGPTLHLYDESHLNTLSLIRRFQSEEGLSLPEIKEAIASGRAPVKSPLRSANVAITQDEVGGKRQAIIDKAIHLFSTHGYENVKISDITDAIQIGKGTFYLYFKDKKELLHECFAAINNLLISSESDPEVTSEQDIVLRMKKRWIFFQARYPHFGGVLQLLQTEAHSDDPVVRQRAINSYRAVIYSIREDIRITQDKGLIASMDPELIAYALIGIMENITFRLTQDDTYSFQAGVEAVEELSRRILTPR